MSFIYPLGLLGLIGVPILIIIYIIKNKYTEQTITSTYIWRLSERFLKNKKPISKLKGLISLILQCLAVVALSFILAHPVLTIANSASEYCFILDASGSMNKIDNGNDTRFEIAKNKIINEIDNSLNGSSYSLILVGNQTNVLFERYTNKTNAADIIRKLDSSYVSNKCNDSLTIAQDYFDNNKSIITYLVTDKTYETKNIKLINVGNEEANYGILSLTYDITLGKHEEDNIEKDKLSVSGEVISYNSDEKLTLSLFIDDTLADTITVDTLAGVKTSYKFERDYNIFTTLKVVIKNSDSLMLDNEIETYNLAEEHKYKALVVSANPFYLTAVLQSYGLNNVDRITVDEFNEDEYEGYNLYIFDSCTPAKAPTDGSVWYFNQKESLEGTKFTYKDGVVPKGGAKLDAAVVYGEDKKFVQGLLDFDFYVERYNTYGVNKSFTTLFTCEGNPVIFTGTSSHGNREVVFGFDLHYSNLPLSYNFLVLARNLLDYSFPIVISESNYVCGDEVNVNVLPTAKTLRLESPSGKASYLDTNSASASTKLTEVGRYKLTMRMNNDEEKVFYLYSSFPMEENIVEDSLYASLNGIQEFNYSDGTYDNLAILFILLGLLFVADWVVYCYEQHQLY